MRNCASGNPYSGFDASHRPGMTIACPARAKARTAYSRSMTRASITLHEIAFFSMNCAVKPGNDENRNNHGKSAHAT
jgi:hypothetical protein